MNKNLLIVPLIYLLIPGAIILISISPSISTVYSTINNGNWTNTTNVWSTNGITPCNCKPGNTITDTIIINHNINMNSNLTVSSGGFVSVSSAGALANLNSNLTVTTGTLESDGIVEAKEIIINSAGSGEFYGPITAETKFMIYGDVVFDDFLSINNGSLELKAGSYISAGPDWLIDIPNGNIYNEGTLDLAGTCLKVNNGSFYNQPGASVTGNGYIETQNGNIYNNGTWSTNVDWCASGSGSGFLTLENCNPPVCASAPLPVTLLYFRGTVEENFNLLEWATASELNNDYFTIERSGDGINYKKVGNVSGSGNSNVITHYKFLDERIVNNQIYYRLSQTDFDGTVMNLGTISLNNKHKEKNLNIYPNPTSGLFYLEYKGETENAEQISILDMQGRIIKAIEIKGAFEFQRNIDISKFENGIYFVNIMSNNTVLKTAKLIKAE